MLAFFGRHDAARDLEIVSQPQPQRYHPLAAMYSNKRRLDQERKGLIPILYFSCPLLPCCFSIGVYCELQVTSQALAEIHSPFFIVTRAAVL